MLAPQTRPGLQHLHHQTSGTRGTWAQPRRLIFTQPSAVYPSHFQVNLVRCPSHPKSTNIFDIKIIFSFPSLVCSDVWTATVWRKPGHGGSLWSPAQHCSASLCLLFQGEERRALSWQRHSQQGQGRVLQRQRILQHQGKQEKKIYDFDRDHGAWKLFQQLYENIGSLYSQSLPGGSGLSSSSSSHGFGSSSSSANLGLGSSIMMPSSSSSGFNSSKYTQLLAVIEEIGKDIRPTYAGNKSSAERLKRGIVHAR